MRSNSSIELTMKRVAIQPTLFASKPSRLVLQSIDCDFAGYARAKVNVWRNHAIEPVLELARPFFFWGGWCADTHISDYDDTLMFSGHTACDVELLWLDSSRYRKEGSAGVEWLEWLGGRLRALRASSTAPIVVATWLESDAEREQMQSLVRTLPAVHFADLAATCAEAGMKLLDQRTAAMAGTPISNAAQTLLARKLACHWLAAAVLPPLKAVALDLDHTLYAGVLGEDGDGVALTEAHSHFQAFAKALIERGIFLALVSRNERPDVEALFTRRADFPLQWQDFSVTEISWDDKAVALARVATALRIATDAVLFVDDNPGELATVAGRLPGVHTVHANENAALTEQAVLFYPGLWRWNVEAEDAKRVIDLKASIERETLLAETADPAEYFRSLQVSLMFRLNPRDELGRLADLCKKTNQFNLALQRTSEVKLLQLMEQDDACVASVRLTDRLADSGVVAVIVARRADDQVIVEELCISCRAMGRHLEDTLILSAIASMPIVAQCKEIAFRVQRGPRNQPAISWLAALTENASSLSDGLHALPADVVRRFVPVDGVEMLHPEHAHR
ncbi:HAD-IIIC family phosphatase [Caballeronia novacaledonica]|uniref:HAD-IIIC family phosphatase n=1 Tax=Caballeronia novacaledonica TaxID=1544861 RepID=UPI001EE2274B|nr:HAD-IIIC family phosphatase [Caballeronia novacaledonica]GJH09278.1 HAD-IIIC family phosphatase [Caballeronia novacaledonica]